MIKREPILYKRKFSSDIKNPFGYIYITTNLVTGKKYIGQHARSKFDKSYYGSGKHLHNSMKTHGKESFICEPIHWCESLEDLCKSEIFYIKELDAVNSENYYNISNGGEFFVGNPMYGENNPRHVSRLTVEQRKEISDRMKARSHDMLVQLWEDESYRKKNTDRMYGENNPMYGRTHTDAVKKKLSELHTGIKLSESVKEKMTLSAHRGSEHFAAKAIVQLDLSLNFIKFYECISYASLDGHDRKYVRACCQHRKDVYHGYKWMYKDEYDELIGGGNKCLQE